MSREQTIEMRAGGQNCKVKIGRRNNGSVWISFESSAGYGFPFFELAELQEVFRTADRLQEQKS